jgi:hypothetical protein
MFYLRPHLTLLLSLIRPFGYIIYHLFPRSLLFLDYTEDGCGKLLRNIGTYMTYSRGLEHVWTPLRKTEISNWCFFYKSNFPVQPPIEAEMCHGVPDLRCTWRVVLICSWGPSACSPETCGAELPGRRTGSILSRLQTGGWIWRPHIIHSLHYLYARLKQLNIWFCTP